MKHPNQKIMLELIKYTRIRTKNKIRVGAFIIKGNKIVAKAISTVFISEDPTAHGEINVIKKLAKKNKSRNLEGDWIYTTMIPCPMCTSAIAWAELDGIVYGLDGRHLLQQLDIHPKEILKTSKKEIKLIGPFLDDECLTINTYKKKNKIKGN